MKTLLAALFLFSIVAAHADDEYQTLRAEEVLTRQAALKGKTFILLNTNREMKQLSPTQYRINWEYGAVTTVVDAPTSSLVQNARTLYVTIDAPGPKSVTIKPLGDTLVDGKPAWGTH
jgi:hypothetical protein